MTLKQMTADSTPTSAPMRPRKNRRMRQTDRATRILREHNVAMRELSTGGWAL